VDRPAPAPEIEIELEIESVAHRGACVARHEGRVLFVRHALPGERVRARVTDASHDRYWRADAVEVLRASPDRVARPCPHAGPGRCGGCDWQHAALPAQRRLKAQVVADTLRRIAGIDITAKPAGVDLESFVEPLPAEGDDGLGWRTRMRFAVMPEGTAGLRAHRSHEVVPTPDCRIAHPLAVAAVADLGRGGDSVIGRGGADAVEVVATPSTGTAVISTEPGRWRTGLSARAGRPAGTDRPAEAGAPAEATDAVEGAVGEAVEEIVETVLGREFRLDPGAFWQVHPAAAGTLVAAVLDALAPAPGETAVDLYAGAGLFAAFLAEAVGPAGRVVAMESAPAAVASAAHSLADLPWAEVRPARVTPASVRALGRRQRDHDSSVRPAAHVPKSPGGGTGWPGRVDIAVLDPPRSGAGPAVMAELLAHRPRRVAYVACDPAALGRDLAAAAADGYRMTALRAFDLFPMTFHVECVATLEPAFSVPRAEPPSSPSPAGSSRGRVPGVSHT